MDPIRTLHPLARAWLLDGPLSVDLDAYLALLERGRYAEGSVEKYLRALAHLSHWMTRCRLAAEQLDEDFVDQFLNHHLLRCDCHATTLRTRGDLSAGLGHLLAVLRLQRVIAQRPSPIGPVAEALCRYDAHMRAARGLAAGTREGRLSIVGPKKTSVLLIPLPPSGRSDRAHAPEGGPAAASEHRQAVDGGSEARSSLDIVSGRALAAGVFEKASSSDALTALAAPRAVATPQRTASSREAPERRSR